MKPVEGTLVVHGYREGDKFEWCIYITKAVIQNSYYCKTPQAARKQAQSIAKELGIALVEHID